MPSTPASVYVVSKKKRVDYAALRRLPILSVAEKLGMQLMRCGSGVFAMKDPENGKASSLTISEKRNTWKRWSGKQVGGVDHGSTIDLVRHFRNCTFEEAVEFLSSSFIL